MNFKNFVNVVKEKLELIYPESEFKIKEVNKLNNVVLTGIMINKEKLNITPTVYLESFFEDFKKGKELSEIVEELIHFLFNDVNISMEFTNDLLTFKQAKHHIFTKLVNYEYNREFLENIPHKKYLNLAIIFYYLVEQEGDLIGTITICNEHLHTWGITTEELFTLANQNTLKQLGQNIYSMRAMFENLVSPEEQFEEQEEVLKGVIDEMYILSNKDKNYGASVILNPAIIHDFAMHNKVDFYLLPSSIHEWIMLATMEDKKAESLQVLVKEINATQVRPEEVLSNSIYYYDYHTKEIRILLE